MSEEIEVDDLEEEIKEIKEEKKNKGIIFSSRAENIDPYLPYGLGHIQYSKEELKVLGYGGNRGQKLRSVRSEEEVDKQWHRLLQEGSM